MHTYRLDVDAAVHTAPEIVLAGGEAGRQNPAYRVTAVLAERLGKRVVDFPSHHAGYVSHPKAFARKLEEVLA